MNETYVRDRIRNMLKSYGYRIDVQTDTVVCYKCHTKIVPPRGKPDMTVVHPITGQGFYIEVKVIRRDETSFAFSRIENHQRRVLTAGGKCSYLGLGEIGPTKTGKGSRLLNIWLIPWTIWRAIEHRYTAFEHRVSIPRYPLSIMVARFAASRKEGLCHPKPLGKNPSWILPRKHSMFSGIEVDTAWYENYIMGRAKVMALQCEMNQRHISR